MLTKKIPIDTIVGPKMIAAPAGATYDKTATIAWNRLVNLTHRGFEQFKTRREKDVWEGQVYILALVLSNSIGMAPPYWEGSALEIVLDERKSR